MPYSLRDLSDVVDAHFNAMGVYVHEIVVEHKIFRVESVSHSSCSVGFKTAECKEAWRTEEEKKTNPSFIVVSFDCF